MAARGRSGRTRPDVTPLLPVTIEPGGVRYAPGMRAGRWVFATGHKGTADFTSGMTPRVTDVAAPRHGLPRHKKEAQQVFANLDKVLKAAGTDRRNVVRLTSITAAGKSCLPITKSGASSSAGTSRRALPTSTSA